jgi:hypothetical protein
MCFLSIKRQAFQDATRPILRFWIDSRVGRGKQIRTLYQCFFTLPSVRKGNVFAISLQLLPASRSVFSRCSSAGVQGVFVRPFLGKGLGSVCAGGRPKSTSPLGPAENGPCGLPYPPRLLLGEPVRCSAPSSEMRRFRKLVGDGSWCCCCC